MKTPSVGIVILNFLGAGDTIACLESLAAAAIEPARVFLLDNGSTDDSVARLRAWNEENRFFTVEYSLDASLPVAGAAPPWPAEVVHAGGHVLLLNDKNLGFAGGNNLLSDLAAAQGINDILLLNNDTTVSPDFLTVLLRNRERFPNAVLIPQIRRHSEPGRVWNCGGHLRWPGRKRYILEGASIEEVPEKSFRVGFVTGCALLYRPEITGALTERFFFGEEDMEFSWRLRRAGITAYCVPEAVVYHKIGRTLADNHRKSEIFTLKRLVNLRNNLGGIEGGTGQIYYLLNLFRLLVGRYRRSPWSAGLSVLEIWRRSRHLTTVGKYWCVDYVKEGNQR